MIYYIEVSDNISNNTLNALSPVWDIFLAAESPLKW